MASMVPLRSADDIDLSRHGVIEASAGTGKTYTIVGLASRILREKETTIERLLMITFTEKAAGEMRHRLRLELEHALGDTPEGSDERRRVLDALDSFGQARISTIHSFCGRLLQEHAFEGRQLLATVVEDEAALLEELLTERVRRWMAVDEDLLELALRVADSPKWVGNAEGWIGTVLTVAAQYTPEAGDRLVPEPLGEGTFPEHGVQSAAEQLRARLACIEHLIGEWDASRPTDDHPLRQRMLAACGSYTPTLKSVWHDYAGPLVSLVAQRDAMSDAALLRRMWEVLQSAKRPSRKANPPKYWQEHGLGYLGHRLSKGWEAHCGELEEVGRLVKEIDTLLSDALPRLAVATIRDLHDDLKSACRERGLMTFSRMISEVHEQVTQLGPDGPLATALRNSLDYAIIDEFQDTDRLQWEILQTAFLSGREPAPRVYIVGDPKQAIYGFRGADIHSYEAACQHLLEHNGAARYSLATNYRARPEVIEACNWLFAEGKWFAEHSWPVEVQPAGPLCKVQAVSEGVDPAGMVVVKLAPSRAEAARHAFARFVADRVMALCPPNPTDRATITLRGLDSRPLQYDDFCILIRNRSEARFYQSALRDRRIPHTFYKEQGLWASEEALQLHYLLWALANPSDASRWRSALLSRFFSRTIADAARLAQCPDTHAARQVFESWVSLAERSEWGALFRRILDASPILLDDLEEAPSDWERRLTNYHHLCQILEQRAVAGSFTIFDIVAYVADRRAAAHVSEDESLLRIETSEPKVQIMTMHASKGLEFPFVFVAGGFSTAPGGHSVQRRYEQPDGEKGRWVIDLAAKSKDRDPDSEAELRRLYYVAITRAAVQVYLPLFSPGQGTPEGPLVWLAKAHIEEAQRIRTPPSVREIDWTEGGGYQRSIPTASVPSPAPETGPTVSGTLRYPPRGLRGLRTPLESYTSLAGQQGREAPYRETGIRLDDDLDEGPSWSALPGGARVGQFFHKALEALISQEDLPAALNDPSLPEALGQIARLWVPTQWLTNGFIDTAADLIRRAVTADLPHLGPLTAIERGDRMPELPFMYPVELVPPGAPTAPELRVHSGMLTGVIDLVARRNGRYYILDWKSNQLPDYQHDRLVQAMTDNNYHLQYGVYSVALDRWLRARLGRNYDRSKHLGGVLYVFLRGLTDDGSVGVFCLDGTELDLDQLSGRELPERLRASLGGDEGDG